VLNEKGVFVMMGCGRGGLSCWVASGLGRRCLERKLERSAGVYYLVVELVGRVITPARELGDKNALCRFSSYMHELYCRSLRLWYKRRSGAWPYSLLFPR